MMSGSLCILWSAVIVGFCLFYFYFFFIALVHQNVPSSYWIYEPIKLPELPKWLSITFNFRFSVKPPFVSNFNIYSRFKYRTKVVVSDNILTETYLFSTLYEYDLIPKIYRNDLNILFYSFEYCAFLLKILENNLLETP